MVDVFKMRATGSGAAGKVDRTEVKRAALIYFDPALGVQIQSLPSARWSIHKGDDLDGILSAVERLSDDKGVYFSLNPCPVGRSQPIVNACMVSRRFLLIDVDAVRPTDTNSTEDEHEAARDGAYRIMNYTEELGWPLPVVKDSGNGWHLEYRIDLPNDDDARKLVKAALHALGDLFDTDAAKVDRSVHDAKRITKLPGTQARKGPHSEERPWRMVRLVFVPDDLRPVTAEQLAALHRHDPNERRVDTGAAPDPFKVHANGTDDDARLRAYARAALEKEVARVCLAPNGERNTTTNKAAFSMGTLVGAGAILEQEVTDALFLAATRAGLPEGEAKTTIRSGMTAGKAKPRAMPQRSAEQHTSANGTAKASPPTAPPAIHRMTDILAMDLPPVAWAVPGLLSEGLSILAGKPKLGKSWMAFNLALTIAGGGTALGFTKVIAGDVLYLSLEDRLRRVQDRARKLLKGIDCEASERLNIAVEWPKQSDRGLQYIGEWLMQAEKPRLVIVDVWQKFRPAFKASGAQYEQDYQAASDLKSLADKHACSVLILHHCKKAAAEDVVDEISGTLGLAGAADGLIILSRVRSKREGKLFITGRDVEEQEMAVEFDEKTFNWKCLGEANKREMGKVRAAILGLFKSLGPGTSLWPKKVAEVLEMAANTIGKEMWRMAEAGILQTEDGGRYTWPTATRPTANAEEF